jgi:CRISPR/Cas system-associated exonuclease Cas4 (RecB family)
MAGTRGHFENGVWVEEKIPDEPSKEGGAKAEEMEKKLDQVSADFSRVMGNIVGLARDLITTEDGHKVIQKKIDDAGKNIDAAIKDMVKEAKKSVKPEGAKEEKKNIKVD